MPDVTEAEKILTASLLRELDETTRTPSYYIQQDLRSNNHSLNEATDVAQNRPLCED